MKYCSGLLALLLLAACAGDKPPTGAPTDRTPSADTAPAGARHAPADSGARPADSVMVRDTAQVP